MLILYRWFECSVKVKEQFKATAYLRWRILHLISTCTGIPQSPPQPCGMPIALLPLAEILSFKNDLKDLRMFLVIPLSSERASIDRVNAD